MYNYIKGILTEKSAMQITVEANGVGYNIKTALGFSKNTVGDHVKAYTAFIVKEDSQTLYGFESKDDRALFYMLISVSGVGATTAIVVMSTLSGGEIFDAIRAENVATLKSVKGIGEKTARQIILDLSKKVPPGSIQDAAVRLAHKYRDAAIEALQALGYNKTEATKRADSASKIMGLDATEQEFIKACLSNTI